MVQTGRAIEGIPDVRTGCKQQGFWLLQSPRRPQDIPLSPTLKDRRRHRLPGISGTTMTPFSPSPPGLSSAPACNRLQVVYATNRLDRYCNHRANRHSHPAVPSTLSNNAYRMGSCICPFNCPLVLFLESARPVDSGVPNELLPQSLLNYRHGEHLGAIGRLYAVSLLP